MLRITENLESDKTVRLRLDGTVSEASFAELEEACRRHRDSEEKIVLLDMAGVVFMNNMAANKLARLRSERLRIVNCSPFIETLLINVDR